MIPITVSFFLKQSEKKGHRPVLSAAVYSFTIVLVLTIAAVALLSAFRAAINFWFTQYLMGALFIFFALSLFGMYEIELPSGLAQFTAKREGSGLVGTIFMALTFTILSFACVAPFLGGFSGTAVQAEMGFTKLLLGGLAFAVTFASPFMVLALFPTLLKTMPKSGSWLNSVKGSTWFSACTSPFASSAPSISSPLIDCRTTARKRTSACRACCSD
jgi:thiol:disulfide interchange protein DsbD